MLWLPWIPLDRRIPPCVDERMERGASDNLDRLLAMLIAERDAVERAAFCGDAGDSKGEADDAG